VAKDYYDILGVGRTASQEEIESAYSRLVSECRPQRRSPGDDDTKAPLTAVIEAAAILMDADRRWVYDRVEHGHLSAIFAKVAAAVAVPLTQKTLIKRYNDVRQSIRGLKDMKLRLPSDIEMANTAFAQLHLAPPEKPKFEWKARTLTGMFREACRYVATIIPRARAWQEAKNAWADMNRNRQEAQTILSGIRTTVNEIKAEQEMDFLQTTIRYGQKPGWKLNAPVILEDMAGIENEIRGEQDAIACNLDILAGRQTGPAVKPGPFRR
jgi:curved DNA-binding protein CbpA